MRDYDLKKLKKKILDEKLAPFYPGIDAEDESNLVGVQSRGGGGQPVGGGGFDFDAWEECPICFLMFPALNRSKCCGKGICTECFLQLKVSKAPNVSKKLEHAPCPFCKTEKYDVMYYGKKSWAEKSAELEDERKVQEAKMRWLEEERQRDEEIARRKSTESIDFNQQASSASDLQASRRSSAVTSERGESMSGLDDGMIEDTSLPPEPSSDSETRSVMEEEGEGRQDDHGSFEGEERTQQQYGAAAHTADPQHALGALADYVPSQLFAMRHSDMELDIDDLMLNQAIFESLVNQQHHTHQQAEGEGEGELRMLEDSRNDGGEDDTPRLPEMVEEDAAVTIQRSFREMRNRRMLALYEAAAVNIQRAFREQRIRRAEGRKREIVEKYALRWRRKAIDKKRSAEDNSISIPQPEEEESGVEPGPGQASDEQVMMRLLSAMDLSDPPGEAAADTEGFGSSSEN